MSRKKISIVSLIGLIVGFILASSDFLAYCRKFEFCNSKILGEYIGVPLLFLSSAVFVFSIISIKLRDEVFQSWKRFTKYFIPIAYIIILLTPTWGSGGFGPGFGGFPDKETMTYWLTTIFSLVSLILVIVKSWRLRKT